jgi:hypothetical protein
MGEFDPLIRVPRLGEMDSFRVGFVSRLEEHRADIYSQFGEDGMIRKALELLPDVPRWCVEFGAWDGRHLSNTHRLMVEEGWSRGVHRSRPCAVPGT